MYHGGRLGGMTRAEAIEFLTKNKGRKVRSSIGTVYGWDSQLGVVNLGDADFVICYDYGGYEPVPEDDSVEDEIENTISFLVEHHDDAMRSLARVEREERAKDNWDDLRDRLFTAEEVSEAQIAAAKRARRS